MTTIDKILKELKPYKDKVVLNPLSDEEIKAIQSKYNKRIPNYFIEFLKKIGLKQDLAWGINRRVEDFRDFSQSGDYFSFGDNGGEDYWLLKFENEDDRTIYEYDYYCDFEIKSLGKTFDELLLKNFENIKNQYEKLAHNDIKNWCVQFGVRTNSGEFLEAELSKFINVKLIKEPEYIETSSAGVKCYKGEIEIEGRKLILNKQILKYWMNAWLYFNWQESIEEMKNNSTIKKIDKALSKCTLQHILIDYGILNRIERGERVVNVK